MTYLRFIYYQSTSIFASMFSARKRNAWDIYVNLCDWIIGLIHSYTMEKYSYGYINSLQYSIADIIFTCNTVNISYGGNYELLNTSVCFSPLSLFSSSLGLSQQLQLFQSAVYKRVKVATPSRQAKSAHPRTRTNATTVGSTKPPTCTTRVSQTSQRSDRPSRGEWVKGKVVTVRQPVVPQLNLPQGGTVEAWSEEPLDYDEELKKHGWRMEVPGDPFGLKYHD